MARTDHRGRPRPAEYDDWSAPHRGRIRELIGAATAVPGAVARWVREDLAPDVRRLAIALARGPVVFAQRVRSDAVPEYSRAPAGLVRVPGQVVGGLVELIRPSAPDPLAIHTPRRPFGERVRAWPMSLVRWVRYRMVPDAVGVIGPLLKVVVWFPVAVGLLFVSVFRKAPVDPLADERRPVWRDLRRTPWNVAVWVRYSPRWVRACLLVTGLGAVAGGAYLIEVRIPQARQHRAVAAGWHAFEAAVRNGKPEEMKAALDAVLLADPTDPLAAARRAALDTADADPTDAPMTALTIRMNMISGDLAGADREAAKRLALVPVDWMAGTTRAYVALTRGDKAAAREFLGRLPRPDHLQAGVDPGGLVLAFQMFRETGRDLDGLFGFVRTNLVPNLGGPGTLVLPAAEKVQLIECYLQPFDPGTGPRNLDGLSLAWSGVRTLADRAVEEAAAAGDAATLIAAARLTPRLAAALVALKEDGQIEAGQLGPLTGEVHDRGKRAWQAVIDRTPADPDGYHGLGLLSCQTGDYVGARRVVVNGLTGAAPSPGLYALFVAMMQAEARPEAAAAVVWDAAQKHPDRPIWWTIAAEAAAAAGRRDLALDGCRRAREAAKDFPPAVRLEARLWADAGDPHRAVQILAGLGEPALTTDPVAARVYSRAVVDAGLSVLLDDYLNKVETAARASGNPATAAAALLGVTDAAPEAARLSAVAERADKLLVRFRENPDLLRAKGLALAQAAEYGTPLWDLARTRAALTTLERLRARLGGSDREAAARLAWLRLKGDDRPVDALRDAAPLLAAEAAGEPLPPAYLEVLGAVLVANGKPAEAARVLRNAEKSGRMTAGGFSHLALALHANGERPGAVAALTAAAAMPQTAQQQVDYRAAARAVKPEAP